MRAAKTVGVCLVTVVAIVALAAPATADRLPEGPGQPLISGDLHTEEAHGVLHCQPIGENLGSSKGESAGVVVVNPKGTHLAAPAGGTCEAIYEAIFGG